MKNWNQFLNEIANVASGGDVAGLGKEPPVKPRKKFAGCEVFEVGPDEYTKCLLGRTKYERWNKKLDMESIDNQEIRSYAHKNPSKSIILQNSRTREMSYLLRR